MASTRELRRKIKSIGGIQKLTQAMQMVAAAKMNRAIQRAQMSRIYSTEIWSVIQNLLNSIGRGGHPLFSHRSIKKVAIIVITTNRGLAGALNAQLLRKVASEIKTRGQENQKVSLFSMGRKGTQFLARYFKNELSGDFPTPDTIADFKDIADLSNIALDRFLNAEFDEVVVAYNKFVSTLRQAPIIRTLLPIRDGNTCEVSREESRDSSEVKEERIKNIGENLFEPSKSRILDLMLPRAVKTQLYQMLLDANASEHAARMIAMKNATENAGEIIGDLTLTMNSVRQAGITQEISEISAGAEALRQ